jgi:hypothetical protein
LPAVAHFATPIGADGKIFIGTQNSLVVYGLFAGTAALREKPTITKRADYRSPVN